MVKKAKKALITGASSGIGRDIARVLDAQGYDLILVARREDRLNALANCLFGDPKIIAMDIGGAENAQRLYELTRDEDVDLLINNAGFGVWGNFTETDTLREVDMIRLDVEAMHVLMKLFLQDFRKKNSGKILNVASAAAFAPGPYMAAYYSCKAYVLRLTQSVAYELKADGINVTVSALCPGPVCTEFNKVAGVHFSMKPLSSKYVAKYAVENLNKGKTIIIPGFTTKAAALAAKIIPSPIAAAVTARIQKNKGR